jgi:hypothetical protein
MSMDEKDAGQSLFLFFFSFFQIQTTHKIKGSKIDTRTALHVKPAEVVPTPVVRTHLGDTR